MGLHYGPRPHDSQCPVYRPTFPQFASLEPAQDLSGNKHLSGFGAWLLQGKSGGMYFTHKYSHFYWFFQQDFRTAVTSAAWSILKQFAGCHPTVKPSSTFPSAQPPEASPSPSPWHGFRGLCEPGSVHLPSPQPSQLLLSPQPAWPFPKCFLNVMFLQLHRTPSSASLSKMGPILKAPQVSLLPGQPSPQKDSLFPELYRQIVCPLQLGHFIGIFSF